MAHRGRAGAGIVAVILIGAGTGLCRAAVARFNRSASLRTLYTQDVFHTGEGGPDDFITGLRLNGDWSELMPRSDFNLSYSPEYFAYADFKDRSHVDHRFRAGWQFTPGRRSTVGLRQGIQVTTRQSGFREAADEEAQPIVENSRRVEWDLEPSWGLDAGRRWRLQTRARYRTQSFQSSDLVDSRQAGLEVSTTSKVGREQRLGVRVRGDVYEFDDGPFSDGSGRRKFVATEVIWTSDSTRIFAWTAGAGGFRGSGEVTSTRVRPTAEASCTWGLRRGRVTLGYDLGYSTSGGLGGSSRSQTGDLSLTHQWGRAVDTWIRGSRIIRDPLEETSSQGQAIHGYLMDAGISFSNPSGFELVVQHKVVRQERATQSTLDYQEASVALVVKPRSARGATNGARASSVEP